MSNPTAPPPYGAPPVPSASPERDSRPKTLAIVALVVGALGFLIGVFGFFPLLGILPAAAALVLLVIAFVLSLVALISKKHGGKAFSIAALIVSVLGGIIASAALVFSIIFAVATAANDRDFDDFATQGPTTSEAPSDEASTPSDDGSAPAPEASTPAGAAPATGPEAEFIAAVRPEITAVMQEVAPGTTEEQVVAAYPDEALVTIGQSVLAVEQVSGAEVARSTFVDTLTSSGMNDDQAARFYDTIANAARQYLTAG